MKRLSHEDKIEKSIAVLTDQITKVIREDGKYLLISASEKGGYGIITNTCCEEHAIGLFDLCERQGMIAGVFNRNDDSDPELS